MNGFSASLAEGWAQNGVSLSGGQATIAENSGWVNYLKRSAALNDGQGVEVTFRLDRANGRGIIYLENKPSGNPNYRRWGLYWIGGQFYRDYVGSSSSQVSLGVSVEANVWYTARLEMGADSSFKLKLWKTAAPGTLLANRTDGAVDGYGIGQRWDFVTQALVGPLLYDEYREVLGQNGLGQRTGMLDGSGGTAWSYDSRGRLVREVKTVTGGGLFKTEWNYNSADMLNWMKYPADNLANVGEQVTYGYNGQGMLSSLYSSNNSYYYVPQTIYDAAGRVDQRWLGAANLGSQPVVVSDYDYHPWSVQGGALRYLKAGSYANRTSLQSFEYNYDAMGNLSWIKDYKAGGIQTQSFTYDNLNRLLSAGASGGTWGTYAESYSYSATSGNLASKGSSSYSYGAQSGSCPDGALSKAHAVVTAGSNSYCYDLNGNMVKRTVSGQSYTLAYNAENQMSGVSGAASAAFVYDGSGVRVKGTAGGVTTVYIGNYFEWTGSTSTLVKYYYAGAVRVAMRSGSSTGQTIGLNFLLGDHLGSTNRMVDPNGVAQAELRYKGWGETRYAYGTMATTFQYTGQRNQAEIGLYYYGARWYDSYLNRWAQPDSIIPLASQGVQAWDRYGYANNNPIRWNDPSGHAICNADGNCKIPMATKTELWVYYKVVLQGSWSDNDKEEALRGVQSVATSLGRVMDQDSKLIFQKAFGTITFCSGDCFGYSLNGYYGRSFGSTIAFKPNNLTPELVSHELGHSFHTKVYDSLGKDVGKSPYNMLSSSEIVDKNGNHVTGLQYGNFSRTMDGYNISCGLKCSYHPTTMMPGGNTPDEDIADMFMNWAFDSFDGDDNGAGTARFQWMNVNMARWISYIK